MILFTNLTCAFIVTLFTSQMKRYISCDCSTVKLISQVSGYLLQTAQSWANAGVTEDGHCQGACRPSSVVLLRPKLRRDRH